jgi:hypothetical protein
MKPLFKVPLKFGLIAGVLGAVLVILLYFIGKQHPFLIPFFLDFRMLLFAIFIYFQLKEIRDFHQQGELYFSQAILSSFIFILTYAILATAIIIAFGYARPDFITSFVAQFREQVSSWSAEDIQRVGKENIDRNLDALSSTNAFWMGYNYFKQCFWIGAIISIILSVILRRQPKN